MERQIGILGVGLGTIYPKDRTIQTEHVANGPTALRQTLWLQALQAVAPLVDAGDLALVYANDPPDMRALAPVFAQIEQALQALWEKVPFVIVQGGGCSIARGTFAAFAKRYPNGHVLWFDGHADFNTEKTTISHYLGGLALSTAVGAAGLPGVIAPRQVTLLSGRGADWNEITAMNACGVNHIYPEHIKQWVELSLPPGDLYVHFDVDVLEQSVMPAVDLPIFPGISIDLATYALHRVADTGRLRGIEFTAYNPTLDPTGQGVHTLIDLAVLTAQATLAAHPADALFMS